MEIIIGWWVIPTIITAAFLVWLYWPETVDVSGYGLPDMTTLIWLPVWILGVCASWIAYLIYLVASK